MVVWLGVYWLLSLLYTGSWKVGVSSGMFIAGGVSQPLPQDGGGGVAGEGVSSDMYTAAGASQPLGGGGRAAGEYCRPALSCTLQLGLPSSISWIYRVHIYIYFIFFFEQMVSIGGYSPSK
jgi:hypothetical protein